MKLQQKNQTLVLPVSPLIRVLNRQSKTSQESEKPSISQGKTLVSKLTQKHKANKVERALDNVIKKFTSAQNSSEENSMSWKRNALSRKWHLKTGE